MPKDVKEEFIMQLSEELTISGIVFGSTTLIRRYCIHYEWNEARYQYKDNVDEESAAV